MENHNNILLASFPGGHSNYAGLLQIVFPYHSACLNSPGNLYKTVLPAQSANLLDIVIVLRVNDEQYCRSHRNIYKVTEYTWHYVSLFHHYRSFQQMQATIYLVWKPQNSWPCMSLFFSYLQTISEATLIQPLSWLQFENPTSKPSRPWMTICRIRFQFLN